ncbi:ParB/RepB/Spo0J family partition protein [Streptomyces sp. Ac-502]|uniref:ParB/RepB/Spo0J family partition protein n=1 Tax=Streptomyces sp. Ac-502 TaxID=3342801 RepID=UPI0038624ADB
MSKAAQLGNSQAFGRATTARSSRRNETDRAINGPGAAEAAITDLPVTLISDNPDNPRNHLRALQETVDSVREVGVILPIVIATVEAYLHERPDRADDLDDGAQYIVVDGHRRLEAARRVGLATIPVRVDNARVSSDEALLEAAFVANYHRDDMTDLEEAQALKSLVDYYGSQTKASKRLGIPQNTISSKLSLLKLSPELQKDLVTGERQVEHVRNLGKLSPEEQKAKADERAETAHRKRKAAEGAAPAPTSSPPAGSGAVVDMPAQVSRRDNPEAAPAPNEGPAPATDHSVPAGNPGGEKQPSNESTRHHAPEPADDLPDLVLVNSMPFDDPPMVLRILRTRMEPDAFAQLIKEGAEQLTTPQG